MDSRAARLAAGHAEGLASLRKIDTGARRLSMVELAAYPRATAGWRTSLGGDPDDGGHVVDIVVDTAFPRRFPDIYLAAPPPPNTWPHVEADGKLCLWPDKTVPGDDTVENNLGRTLVQAWDLLTTCVSGANVDDFRAEFLSYWDRARTTYLKVWSAVTAAGPTRPVTVLSGPGKVVITDDDVAADAWMLNSGRNDLKVRSPGVLVWLPEPPVPSAYPVAPRDVMAIAAANGALPLLEAATVGDPSAVWILLGSSTDNGPGLVAVCLTRGPRQCRDGIPQPAFQRGFRRGRMPPTTAFRRWSPGSQLDRAVVQRCDAEWVHGRGHDGNLVRLRTARVAVVGCGSLGGRIAVDLASAGVGNLVLVDHDRMSGANVGRHVLGMEALGMMKVEALARRIRQQFPHLGSVQCLGEQWETALARTFNLFRECDLIVGTFDDWPAVATMNEWHVGEGRHPPILYAWTEPRAAAAHAVLIGRTGGCLGCGCQPNGHPRVQVTEWPEGAGLVAEPACGGSFSPYGPTELSFATSMVSEMAMEALLGPGGPSRHRVWTARRERLLSSGGNWAREWLEGGPGRELGGRIEDVDWPEGPCPGCSAKL